METTIVYATLGIAGGLLIIRYFVRRYNRV